MAHSRRNVNTPTVDRPPELRAGGADTVESRETLADDPFVMLYHELRHPLGVIATTALSAVDDCATDSVARRRLERISRVAERTLRVTEGVLAVARADVRPDEEQTFRPATVLLDLLADWGEGDGAQPLLHLDSSAAGIELPGRAAQFEGMLQALLTNVEDHAAGARPEITVQRVGDALTVTVSNPLAAQDRHCGLGIGSYLAQRLAEELGGTLETSREAGRFLARFTCLLPEWQGSPAVPLR